MLPGKPLLKEKVFMQGSGTGHGGTHLLSFGAVAPGLGIILFKPCKNPWGRRVTVFLLQGKT